jgi:hypothetical protein
METKDELVDAIRTWVTIDNKMLILQKELKELRQQKKDMSSSLVNVMKNNEIDVFNIKGGQLCYSQRKSKAAITKKSLLDILSNYYKNQPNKVDEVSNYILDNREEKITEVVRRKIDK